MATEIQLFYIGTSKKKDIRHTGEATYHWGSYGKWTKFKSPRAKSSGKVKLDKKAKSKVGKSKYGGAGGVTVLGTRIPATATKTIDGVQTTVQVRYYVRGHTLIKKTATLTKQKKMYKTVYTTAKPYWYRLQYKDKMTYETAYSEYRDGVDYIYFADYYYANGVRMETNGHLPHPKDVQWQYSDVRKNFESNANNSDSRDNKGKYVLSNVRANIVTMTFTWAGLSAEEGTDLLATLNPSEGRNYLLLQYRNPATGRITNGTFFADVRTASKYSNGMYKEITVTVTEV